MEEHSVNVRDKAGALGGAGSVEQYTRARRGYGAYGPVGVFQSH